MSNRNIHFFLEQTNYRVRNKNLMREWVLDVITLENKVVGELNIILCNDEYLHRMNVEYLDHDTFTDIITFDYSEEDAISGELFISINRIKENSKVYSKSAKEELHRVIIHGVLHLCGYADKTKKEKELMTSKENLYLSKRPLKLGQS